MGTHKNRIRRRRAVERQHKPFFDKEPVEGAQPFFSNDAQSIQAKLSIGKNNDPLESDADAAAKQVLNQQQVQRASQKEEDKPVQKAEKKEEEQPVQKAEKKEEEQPVQKAEKKEEEKPVQKAEKKEEEKPVQAKHKPNLQAASEKKEQQKASAAQNLENLLKQRKGRGFALPEDLRQELEGKFKADFSQVRIHTDTEANSMCESIQAYAFTHGYDIYFNAGKYNPDSPGGKELLAHELAHVVQQNG